MTLLMLSRDNTSKGRGCYTAIAAGTMSGGWKIVKTMGTRITKVTPLEGIAAETAGAIIGVGLRKRVSAVRWGITISLMWAWVLTIPFLQLWQPCFTLSLVY